MTQYELNFSLLVEQMLSKIVDPAYRQIIVEVRTATAFQILTQHALNFFEKCGFVHLSSFLILPKCSSDTNRDVSKFQCFMVLSTILERNKELSFKGSVDLDKVRQFCLCQNQIFCSGFIQTKSQCRTCVSQLPAQ